MKSQILHYASLYLVAKLSLFLFIVKAEEGCRFPHLNPGTTPAKMLQPIQSLVGKRYSVMDQDQKFRYDIGICKEGPDPSEAAQYGDVGVLQTKKMADGKEGTKIIIGRFTNTKIMKGTNWVLLEYEEGDNYGTHCSKEARRARIFITCDESVALGQETIRIVEEFNNATGTNDCYYLFEMQSSVTCQKAALITVSLSFGSIIIIVFVCVLVLYLVGGFLYNRFVLGAKGVEQIPNYSFWQDFGNLQADGCNFVCRSGSRQEPRSYKGIGDDQLQEEEERDDHLLPM